MGSPGHDLKRPIYSLATNGKEDKMFNKARYYRGMTLTQFKRYMREEAKNAGLSYSQIRKSYIY